MIHVLQVCHVIKPIYHQIPVAFSYVHFTLYDSDNGMPILEKQDFRDKMNRLIIDNTTPKDLYKRILGSFSSLLNSKMN